MPLYRAVISKFKCRPTINSLRSFYDSRTKHDTIFAPSTTIQPVKGSPLGVVRLSGDKVRRVIEQFTGLQKNLIQPRKATLTKILTPTSGELIDIGLILWFPKPASYTGEDVCEFHLHGSKAIMISMLTALGSINGLRPAEPGEFTRRAVFNNKLSLIQAESLPDLISSQTDEQRRLALKGLDGSTRHRYELWKRELIGILAHLEASIDFGEDELIGEREVISKCILDLKQLSGDISTFIRVSSRHRELVRQGLRIAILGKPNAGKSTLMNLLCMKDRSIVSDLSGTTRDVVEHSFELDGHAITLCDTAGLRSIQQKARTGISPAETLLEQHDAIEKEGISRALGAASEANLIIYLVDGTNLTGSDEDMDSLVNELDSLMQIVGRVKTFHLIINKIDLNDELLIHKNDTLTTLLKSMGVEITFMSCSTRKNFQEFQNKLSRTLNRLNSAGEEVSNEKLDIGYVNERHLSLLNSVSRHLEQASNLNLATIDEMAQHVRESVDYLSRIVGSVSNEDVFDVIFRDFCIGK